MRDGGADPKNRDEYTRVHVTGRPAPVHPSVAEAIRAGILIPRWTREDEEKWRTLPRPENNC